jgi:dolichyl-phosphate-mannose-protein mannosyltransferase
MARMFVFPLAASLGLVRVRVVLNQNEAEFETEARCTIQTNLPPKEPLDAGTDQQRSTELQQGRGFAISRVVGKPIVAVVVLGMASLAVFLMGLGNPTTPFFDELYFVPEARAFIQGTPNPHPYAPPLAKPPLGKLLMAVGMKAAGDNSFGWRVAGAACGALTLPAVFLWVYLLVGDAKLAYVAAGLAFTSNFLFVMSRIAMMDAFLMFFLLWSLVAFTAALTTSGMGKVWRRVLFVLAGTLLGMGGACKWNAVDTLAVLSLVSFALVWIARRPPTNLSPSLARYADNIREIGLPTVALGMVLAPLGGYLLPYWPLCLLIHRPFTLPQLAAMHALMWRFNSTAISNRAITLPWYAWPLNLAPQRALSYLVGNPVVTLGGLAAIAFCLRRFWKTAGFAEGMVLLLYASNYLQWAVTPEKGLFYYYYYPCVMILCAAIAVALHSLPARLLGVRLSFVVILAAIVVFVWCYPRMAHLQAPWDCALGCWS